MAPGFVCFFPFHCFSPALVLPMFQNHLSTVTMLCGCVQEKSKMNGMKWNYKFPWQCLWCPYKEQRDLCSSLLPLDTADIISQLGPQKLKDVSHLRCITKKKQNFLCINLLLYPVMMKNLRYGCRKECKLTRSQKRGFYSLITKPGSIDNSLPQMISNETHRNLSSWFALRNTEGVPLWIRPRHSSAQRAKNVTALLRELCTLMFVDKVLRWEWSCVQMMLYTGRGTT